MKYSKLEYFSSGRVKYLSQGKPIVKPAVIQDVDDRTVSTFSVRGKEAALFFLMTMTHEKRGKPSRG